MADLTLKVNGVEYAGWTNARVTRSIEAISGSFELEHIDRWDAEEAPGPIEPWPIFEEDECSLEVGGVEVIRGYVDRRSVLYSATEHRLSVTGRDRTAAMVDCSADLRQWEFRRIPLLTLARRLAEPFALGVGLQAGVVIPRPPGKFSVDPGETAFDALESACRLAGLLPVCDGAGGVRLTRAGEEQATTELVQGENILAASAEYDASGRYHRYIVMSQQAGTDDLGGEAAARVRAEARDENVRRKDRVLIIRPDSSATPAYAKQRAAWEATVRAGRSRRFRVTVQGWHQGDGTLWPLNARLRLRSPLLGVDDELLITEVVHALTDSQGTTTELMLMPITAFDPEPVLPPRPEPGKETLDFAPAPIPGQEER